MKPSININHPIVKEAIDFFQQKMYLAMDVPQTVEQAVLPIYTIPKRKGHEKPKTKAEQIGSGVLMNIKEEYFIISATHVMEELNGYPIMIGGLPGDPIVSIKGESICAGKAGGGQYLYDASVYHIQTTLNPLLKPFAITTDAIDLSEENIEGAIYLTAGFRTKRSNTAGNIAKTHRDAYPSIELGLNDYKAFNINSQSHIALVYENQVLVDGNWQTAPTLRGMSGGAIMRIDGINLLKKNEISKDAKQKLSAITIEQHKQRGQIPGRIIGTRIGVHLGLIYQNFPGLLDDMFTE